MGNPESRKNFGVFLAVCEKAKNLLWWWNWWKWQIAVDSNIEIIFYKNWINHGKKLF